MTLKRLHKFFDILPIIYFAFTGMIFAKLSRPKKRAETLMFSRSAAICLRDGALCLMFRIGDMRSSHLIEAHVRGMVVRRRVTREGEVTAYIPSTLLTKVGC